MERTSTVDSADIGWFVVEWGQVPDADLAVTKAVAKLEEKSCSGQGRANQQ